MQKINGKEYYTMEEASKISDDFIEESAKKFVKKVISRQSKNETNLTYKSKPSCLV